MSGGYFHPAWLRPAAVAGSAPAEPYAGKGLRVDRLSCEWLANPSGIAELQPRLGWIVESGERGQRQTAYQVLVAGSEAALKKDAGDLWDSGKVESDQSIQVNYAGTALTSRQECFWKVCVWDHDGRRSGWSQPSRWSMGLLQPADWQGKWIGKDEAEKTVVRSVVGHFRRPTSKTGISPVSPSAEIICVHK